VNILGNISFVYSPSPPFWRGKLQLTHSRSIVAEPPTNPEIKKLANAGRRSAYSLTLKMSQFARAISDPTERLAVNFWIPLCYLLFFSKILYTTVESTMMGVFTNGKLKDDVFCLTQERDFFQSRYLEQVSQIQDMKQEIEAYRKEIDRLRQELLNQQSGPANLEDKSIEDIALRSMTIITESKLKINDEHDTDSVTDSESVDSPDDDNEEREDHITVKEKSEGDDDEISDIRQNAAKLLQWANYRTSVRGGLMNRSSNLEDDSVTESYTRSYGSSESIVS
jgi:hypothetical protein